MQPSTRHRGTQALYVVVLIVSSLVTIVSAVRLAVAVVDLLIAALPLLIAAAIAVAAYAQLRDTSIASVLTSARRAARKVRASFGSAIGH